MVTEGGGWAGWIRDQTAQQQGDFVWHKHDGEDEMLLVIEETGIINTGDAEEGDLTRCQLEKV